MGSKYMHLVREAALRSPLCICKEPKMRSSMVISVVVFLLVSMATDAERAVSKSSLALSSDDDIAADDNMQTSYIDEIDNDGSIEATTTAGHMAHHKLEGINQTFNAKTFTKAESYLEVQLGEANMQMQKTQSGFFSLGKFAVGAAASLACVAVLYKLCGKINCNSRKFDVRRCSPIARFLLYVGYDEFPSFRTTVSVHNIKDVLDKSVFGKGSFKVTVKFYWSKFETAPTQDMRWEQTKTIDVPQGASSCYMTLFREGKLGDKKIGEIEFDTKKDMLDKANFWGEKQNLKMETKGKLVGTLMITFRKIGGGNGGGADDGSDSDGEGGVGSGARGGGEGGPIVSGVSQDSPLHVEFLKTFEDENLPVPSSTLDSEKGLALLAKVLSGPLREVNKKGKESGKVYVRVINCNFAELQGSDRSEVLRDQVAKAKKKGLQQLEKKWYWCWYEDKKAAEKKWNHPDGFIPLAAVTSVHRSPERQDQFLLRYSDDGGKDQLVYRRETGKGLEVWMDGGELLVKEVRKQYKDKKKEEDKNEQALKQMEKIHATWVKQYGVPKNQVQWKQWVDNLKSLGYPDPLIQKFFQEKVQKKK